MDSCICGTALWCDRVRGSEFAFCLSRFSSYVFSALAHADQTSTLYIHTGCQPSWVSSRITNLKPALRSTATRPYHRSMCPAVRNTGQRTQCYLLQVRFGRRRLRGSDSTLLVSGYARSRSVPYHYYSPRLFGTGSPSSYESAFATGSTWYALLSALASSGFKSGRRQAAHTSGGSVLTGGAAAAAAQTSIWSGSCCGICGVGADSNSSGPGCCGRGVETAGLFWWQRYCWSDCHSSVSQSSSASLETLSPSSWARSHAVSSATASNSNPSLSALHSFSHRSS